MSLAGDSCATGSVSQASPFPLPLDLVFPVQVLVNLQWCQSSWRVFTFCTRVLEHDDRAATTATAAAAACQFLIADKRSFRHVETSPQTSERVNQQKLRMTQTQLLND